MSRNKAKGIQSPRRRPARGILSVTQGRTIRPDEPMPRRGSGSAVPLVQDWDD